LSYYRHDLESRVT